MSLNPYAPPTSSESAAPPPGAPGTNDVVWFSPAQVGWATLFGTPLAAGWLLRANARAAQNEDGAKLALWSGIGGTLLLFALALVLPDSMPGSLLGVVTALTAHSVSKLQWTQRARAHGTPRTAETGRAVKVTLSCLVAAVAVAVALGIVGVLLFPEAEIWQE